MYAAVFPKYYVLNNKDGINIRAKVVVCHKKWIDSKQQQQQQKPIAVAYVAKEPLNYKDRPANEFEQKPITGKFNFSVPKQRQQLYKQLKRAAVAAPVNFLTAKQQMDAKCQAKKVKQEERKENSQNMEIK